MVKCSRRRPVIETYTQHANDTIETAHGLGQVIIAGPGTPENDPETGESCILNEYIEQAYGEFLKSQRHLEKTIRREENKAEESYWKKEHKFLEQFQSSLDQAIQIHEKAISQSIKTYENALKNAAQTFISSKEEAEHQYLDTLKKNSQNLRRLLEEARLSKNADIDACHRRSTRR